MPLQLPTEKAHSYLNCEEVQTRFPHGASSSQDSKFISHVMQQTPPGPVPPRFSARPPPPPVILSSSFNSFNRRISDAGQNGPSEQQESPSGGSAGRLPQLALLHGGGGSRRSLHPILSVHRRQTDITAGMQLQHLQQTMSSPGQGEQTSQFRLSLPSLAPRAPDARNSPTLACQPNEAGGEQALHNRILNMSLSFSPTKPQALAHGSSSVSSMQTPTKPMLPGASPLYTPLKPAAVMSQVPEDSLFLASPFMAQVRSTTLTTAPLVVGKCAALPPKAVQEQEQQQPGAQRPESEDGDVHYELDADFEAEAAKQRRMSSAHYIKTPAGQEKALCGGAPIPTELELRAGEEDEYEDEEQTWVAKPTLLEWLDVNVQLMRRKGRVL